MANNNNPSDLFLITFIQTNLIEDQIICRKFLFRSSCIYPKLANQPINEEELLSGQLEVTNQYYAIAKIAGIKLCEALAIQKDLILFV